MRAGLSTYRQARAALALGGKIGSSCADQHRAAITARKMHMRTGREPLVSTGFLSGTGRSVLNVTAFSTGRSDQYQMTQSSTGHQHRPVLKIFLSKKSNCFSGSSSFLSPFFFLSTIMLHLSSLFFKNRLLFFTNREKAVGRKEVCS